jgi:DNA-nicking Smr family endonuclease
LRYDPAVAKKPPPFHNPFVEAQKRLGDLVKPVPAAPARAPPPKKQAPAVEESEARLFEDEMAGVARMAPDPRGRVRAPEPPSTGARPSQRALDEAEAYAQLADLVDGAGHFDIVDTDEFIEGIAPGLDRRILRKLKRGDFALQGHLDLHGMNREEARVAVEKFVGESRAAGRRCVLIIHGRGQHSKDQLPILKERLKAWLERGRVGKAVLAFATARPHDGGLGAVYVLLRK